MDRPGLFARFLGRRATPAADLSAQAHVRGEEDIAAALLDIGFDADAYRALLPTISFPSDRDAAAHYDACGRHERFAARFHGDLPGGLARIDRLGVSSETTRLLRQDVAAACLRATDVHGADIAETRLLLTACEDWRPLLVVSDSHGMFYLSEDVLRLGGFMPAPFLCTGVTARGLGNPDSVGGAGLRIQRRLADLGEHLRGATVLLKFGQVDLEFVHDYRRIAEGRRPFDMGEAVAYARESVRRYTAFVARLAEQTPARLVVTAALPPALSDSGLRDGHMNAHIVSLYARLDAETLRRELEALDLPDWATRTRLSAAYNAALAEACAEAGLLFHDDFTDLVGPEGRIDEGLIVWHGGTDHHLCSISPAARAAAVRHAAQIAELTSPAQP